MSYWLALVLRERREGHAPKIRPSQVAALALVDQSTISRLEAGQSLPPDIDCYVAAYAKLLGLEDGRELWRSALERWMREGAPPVLSGELEAESAIEQRERDLRETLIRERARERQRSEERKPSTRRKRADG